MTSIESITLEVDDLAAAEAFYAKAFPTVDVLRLRESGAATSGFRGFHISLVAAQPGTVDNLADSAVGAGATVIKPVAKSMWGYGGVLRAPDGTIWKVVSQSKKNTGPAGHDVENVVVLFGADDVKASKAFYVQQGLTVGKSFGRYVEFSGTGPVGFSLLGRKALAKDAGVPAEGGGSHRIVLHGDVTSPDPDGFTWEPA